MADSKNLACTLKARPKEAPTVEDTFLIKKVPIPKPEKDGEVLLRITMISVDPYMRGRMNDSKSYVPPFQVGEPLNGAAVAHVVESKFANLSKGDLVHGFLPWQQFVVANGKGSSEPQSYHPFALNRTLTLTTSVSFFLLPYEPPSQLKSVHHDEYFRLYCDTQTVRPSNRLEKLDTAVVPAEKYMSSAGYSGLSSYLPIKYIAEPKKGETVFVTGGAGAVGSCACQIFQTFGCHVVTCAGSNKKVKWINDLGIEAFNYKEVDLDQTLAKLCPKGIDIYFDNVGGKMLETTLTHMNNFGRVLCCGMISQYNKKPEDMYGIKNLFLVTMKRLKLQGFVVWDFGQEKKDAAVKDLVRWIKDGKLKTTETVVEGFSKLPEAFVGLFTGKNLGKMLVKVG